MKVQNTATTNIVKSPAQLELIILKLKQEVKRLKQKLRLLGVIDEDSIDFGEDAIDVGSFAPDIATESSQIVPASVFGDQSNIHQSGSSSHSGQNSASTAQEQAKVPEPFPNDILGQYMAQAAAETAE